MKSNQKLSILFWLFKAKATKDGKAPIYVRITIDGLDDEISLGKKVHPYDWCNQTKKVTASGMEAKLINIAIDQARASLTSQFMVLQSQFECITPTMLKNVYKGKPVEDKVDAPQPGSKKQQTLLQAFDEHIEKFELMVERGMRSDNTLRHWRKLKRHVTAFIKFQYKASDLNFSELSGLFAEELYEYLTLHKPKPLAEVSARKDVKWTRQIVKIGVKKDFITRNPMEGFKCSGGDVEVIPLEFEQVERIHRKKLHVERLVEVRDAFIFQCFTGFAYQDIYGLTRDSITLVGPKRERWLVRKRGKTQVGEMVPILPIVEELIQKYKSHPYCVAHDKLIPVNSNFRYNTYLKELADICDIRDITGSIRKLDTHDARHFFADMMLNNGVPLEDVSKMLGHRNIRTTMRYCRVRKSRISENVGLVRDRLFTKTGKLRQPS
ncbi:site-specific integrase [Dyadobacter fermentans]|uniref:Integrase family protein n=1 Tax=Dyadobacter fermentans (strain ATCC 700827 / DSM 18053 / CIP 107007 / KCTC 52180 / NS114) TaxID=471854 RepID=C6W340_DYAFD|nr:site-specific integrase [Dyadobacter fermentans]ACT92144.1 integrase family protein [Dyadobacter fermentans DSM 18053]